MSKYKVIETVYAGYKFRSRLEARWAVFMDELGIEYRYEPEGFDLDGIWYLPDFYLPKLDYWVEIKPDMPTHEEREKAIKLCVALEKPVAIFGGEISPEVAGFGFGPFKGYTRDNVLNVYTDVPLCWLSSTEYINLMAAPDWIEGFDLRREYAWSDARWIECPQCQAIAIYAADYTAKCSCGSMSLIEKTERLVAAFNVARQARFEHGGR